MKGAAMKYVSCVISLLCFALCVTGSTEAQTAVTQTINAKYSNLTTGYAIPNDFAGLSFETGAVVAGNDGMAPNTNLFSASNTQLVNLFQQMGLRNLRIGGGSVNSYFPSTTDIQALFGFAPAAGVKVIYSVPLDSIVNGKTVFCGASTSADGQTVAGIWTSYAPYVASFAIGNEEDANGTLWQYVNGGYQSCPGWKSFESTIAGTTGAMGAPFSGPDSGSYNGNRLYSGTLCGTTAYSNISWATGFAYCGKASELGNFTDATQHFYTGGSTCNGSNCATTAQAIDDMLSSAWVTTTTQGTQTCGGGSCTYYPYNYVYNTMLGNIVSNTSVPYRLTELNEFLGGVSNPSNSPTQPGASNGFAAALWSLDVMHWFATKHAAGVNFHNKAWIPTDTVIPGNLPTYSGSCTGSGGCTDFMIVPKGYGIKTFDLGGHGYTVGVSNLETSMPNSGSLDTYAVGSGQDLYVTLINKTNVSSPGSDNTASVTLNVSTSDAPFVAASVATLKLWNGDSGATSDPSQPSAQLGGATISNSAQWSGYWTGQTAMTSGSTTVSVPPATAMLVRLHAPSSYVGPIQMDQNGSLEAFVTDSSGNLYHDWQLAGDLNTEPNSAPSNWNGWSQNFSGAPMPAGATGDVAVAKNLDNSLQIFLPTTGDVYYNRQSPPGAGWAGWVDMGGPTGLSNLKAARNADGGLTVFGLDGSNNLYYNTENAPSGSWSGWSEINASGQKILPGYAVAENINGRLEVFGADSSHTVYHAWQTLGNTWTTTWTSLGTAPSGNFTPYVQVARDLSNHLNIFVLTSSGTVYTNSQPNWTSWSTIASARASPLQPGFVAGQNANGRFELFGVGADSNLYHTWITTGGTWNGSWTSLSSPTGGLQPQLMVGNTNDGRLQVFGMAIASPNDIWTNWQESISGSWNGWTDFGSSSSGLIF
jgi:hypothetical protein